MIQLPDSISRAVRTLSELPSIGPRQATRLVFWLLGRKNGTVAGVAQVIAELGKVKVCERCFFVHENAGNLCSICENGARKQNLIMIVEKETDLMSVENTGKFSGRYLVLGLIPKSGALEETGQFRLETLKRTIERDLGGQAEEIILGFSPTAFGNFAASVLAKELTGYAKRLTRLGQGIPSGGEIEFADDETLGSALEGRK